MPKAFGPLLSATIEPEIAQDQLKLLEYPLIGSPKLDGIRALCTPSGIKSRSMKLIPNLHIRQTLVHTRLIGLDGELIVGLRSGPGVMSRAQSGVMSQGGTPDFTYWIFDYFAEPSSPYDYRLMKRVKECWDIIPQVQVLEHKFLGSVEEVLAYEEEQVAAGFEGIMLRHPRGIYKYGRSTFNQQILLKMKRFTDDEATIVGFEELQENQNVQTRDEMGYARRSSHKAGMAPGGTLGKFVLSHPRWGTFSCGSGLDDVTRRTVWDNRPDYLGRQITFKYQAYGSVDAPRIPIFKGFRAKE